MWPTGYTLLRFLPTARDDNATAERIILGVAGGSGSGWTTAVEEIRRRLHPFPGSVIHHDA